MEKFLRRKNTYANAGTRVRFFTGSPAVMILCRRVLEIFISSLKLFNEGAVV